MEEWKDIEGYEGLYQVSNEGRVKALERVVVYKNGHIHKYKEHLMDIIVVQGYCYVGLNSGNKQKRLRVHRLVAQAFIPNPNGYVEINHRDENTKNNKVENLEWCDRTYNINYGTRNKKVGKHFEKKVYQYSIDGELLRVFDSLTDAANFNRYNIANLSTGCRDVKKGVTRCGYFFSFTPLTKDELNNAKFTKEFYAKHRNSQKYVELLQTL